MNIPCKVKALKYIKYGDFEMNQDEVGYVTLAAEKGNNRYRMLRVSTSHSQTTFTEAALEYAIERGDFSLV